MIDKIFATIVFATIGLILIVKLRRFILERSGSAKNIWNFLGNQSVVESSIIDSNPRVAYALQPAFRGAIGALVGSDMRNTKYQIVSSPDDQWVAAYLKADLMDKPYDGLRNVFKAEAQAFVFARRLEGFVPEISFRNKMFTRSRPLFYMPAWKVERGELTQCEGVFMKNFDMYARPVEQIAALAFAATDLLASIEINADISDVYFVHNYVYYISPVGRMKKDIIERVFESSKRLVAEVNTNLSRV